MHTISIANQKGGVGKTTLTVNLAAELARMGKRVLIVDMDAQHNATDALCGDALQPGDIFEVLNHAMEPEDAVMEAGRNLWVLPGSTETQFFDSSDEGALRRALAAVKDNFDFCLVDTPPALDIKTMNAFVASDFLLVVTEPDTFSAAAVEKLLKSVGYVRKIAGAGKSSTQYGVVINKTNRRRGLNKHFQDEIRFYYKECVFQTALGDYTQVPLAAHAGRPLCEAYPKCVVRAQFRSVALELLDRLEEVQ